MNAESKLRVLVIGAHPDDCEFKAGGVAAKYAALGHTVRFVSMTNGDAGHHEIGGVQLARRRKAEAEDRLSLGRHELNELADQLPNVANAQVLVEDTGNELRFLHRVVKGGANRSYGIEAARLAGVPPAVVLRARQVLGRIEANSHVAVA